LALKPTGHNLEMIKYKKIKTQKRLELEKLSALEQKQKLEELTLTIEKKAGESDTLFGSVTTIDIQEKLAELGTQIDRKKIHLDEPIKKLGHHLGKVKLIEDIEAEIKIEVVRQNEETEEK
jgi:large subunit ribosomal protein L9